MYQFEIYRPKSVLEGIRQGFERNRIHFTNIYENRYHISHLQIYPHSENQHVGITVWPQFWGTVIPNADYVLIAYADETHNSVYLGKKDDIFEIIKLIGVSEQHNPIHHYVLPHIIDSRWKKRIIEVTQLIDQEAAKK